MKFPEYVKQQVKVRKHANKTEFLKEFAKECGVAFVTLSVLERGSTLVRYDKAKKLSEATGNKVTIRELCEK